MSQHLEILMDFQNLIRRNFSASINVMKPPTLSRQVWAIPWTYSISNLAVEATFMANLELSSQMEPLDANGYLEHQLERELFLISVFFQDPAKSTLQAIELLEACCR